jgi:hypothetical protein
MPPMKLLANILTQMSLAEATTTSAIYDDPTKIASLADSAVKQLIATHGSDIKSARMAVIATQVRSHVDGVLLDDKIRLTKENLNKVVDCVLKHIQKNAKAYILVESQDPTPETTFKEGCWAYPKTETELQALRDLITRTPSLTWHQLSVEVYRIFGCDDLFDVIAEISADVGEDSVIGYDFLGQWINNNAQYPDLFKQLYPV